MSILTNQPFFYYYSLTLQRANHYFSIQKSEEPSGISHINFAILRDFLKMKVSRAGHRTYF